jgi:FkbM family methyltransferase
MKSIHLTIFFICLTVGLFAANYQNFEKNLHFDRLSFLRDKGFEPKVIYDIGAHHGDWSLQIKEVFPKAEFFLFEANESNKPFLNKTAFPYYLSLLGDEEKTVTFYANNSTGDSIFCEQTRFYQEGKCVKKKLPMTTLACIVAKNQIPKPDLIKFDVQGAEKMIIQGSKDVVKSAEVVILEAKILEYNKNAPLTYEIMTLMNNLGYSLLDILECHYLPSGELNEVDFLFVKNNSNLIKKGVLIQ